MGGYHAVAGPILAAYMGWPNCLFIPEDSLHLLLYEAYDVEVEAPAVLVILDNIFEVHNSIADMPQLYSRLLLVFRRNLEATITDDYHIPGRE